jgi:hypothetical protein
MNEPLTHADIEELLVRQRHEPLSADDAARLQAHLGTCESCRRFDAALDAGLRSLASLPIAVPAGLTAATRLRLRRRNAELAEAVAQMRLIAAASVLAGALGLATARALWLGVDWFGQQWGLSFGVLLSLFVVVWFVPATLGGLAVIVARSRQMGLARAVEEELS